MSPDYLEARRILEGTTAMLTEKRHLEALNEYYQSQLIRLVYDIELVTQAALKRN